MKRYVIAHDIGTSSDKAILADFGGNIEASASCQYETFYPRPGWVEQNPEDYWEAVVCTTKQIIAKNGIEAEDIAAVVFTTQAMGVIPVDEAGKVLRHNITWVDSRAQKQADEIMGKFGGEPIFKALSGTPVMGKDVLPKLLWIKQEEHDVYKRTNYFLDVNGYLKMKCTDRMVAEWSGASSYGFDLKKKDWMRGIFGFCGIDVSKLPPLVKATDCVGGLTEGAAAELDLIAGIPVFGGCDDVQSAVIGSGMTADNNVHIYLGTSAWVCAVSTKHRKFKSGAAAVQSADPQKNLIVGITEAAGSNIQWIADQFFKREKEQYKDKIYDYMDKAVESIPPGSDYLICTPWMLGERCPVSTTTTRATLFNISQEHTREHLMRSVYEGVGFNIKWILDNFKRDYGFSPEELRVIGGGALDSGWMQIIADITGIKLAVVGRPRDAGSLGGALLALIGLGIYKNFEEVSKLVGVEKIYLPDSGNVEIYSKLFHTYKDIYNGLKTAYRKLNAPRFN